MRAQDLRFPVLKIAREGTIAVAADAAGLETTNRLAIKNGYFDRLRLVEQSGRAFEVTSAVQVWFVGPLFGLRFMKPRSIRVALDFQPIGALTLQELRKRVLACMDQQRELWESVVGLDMWEIVRQARTMEELFAALN